MLSAKEFTIGTLADAKPGTLVLPKDQEGSAFMIGEINGEACAIFLSGKYVFEGFLSAKVEDYSGIIIPNVSIEIDETSAIDPRAIPAVLGTVIRTKSTLGIRAKLDDFSSRRTIVSWETNLPEIQNQEASFARWQMVLGTGQTKRVLMQFNRG